MSKEVLDIISNAQSKKQPLFAVLLDPDSSVDQSFIDRVRDAERAGVDLFFVGGSLMSNDFLDESLKAIKAICDVPVVLFPGSTMQISAEADALLFLSLISGRNADLLIGQHVIAAPYVKKANIEVIPTGYMLVDGGAPTTAHYVSQTMPIPRNKPNIAATTALAGEMLGMQLLYLDAGSGADFPVSFDMIRAVKNTVSLPIVVGGGMKTDSDIRHAVEAGADVVVVGNALESGTANLENLIHAAKGSV
ncbi:MAG: geranylgeranylglyceryl/heptaprenylglyceryl phosphate synthase [Cryomorphaceae bacterium]|nr:geranylgeranylglyceryl/heptaprenylglyceryl phosphate synthase [Cryomorphaceae bacterium]